MARNGLFRDRVGDVYGGWTVLSFVRVDAKWKSSVWLCRCECGVTQECSLNLLRICGKCWDCGVMSAVTTHGMTGTPTYESWQKMLKRCHKKTAPEYPNYGGRGIRVCGRWRRSFENFYADMGERPANTPAQRFSLGRINNDKGYHPSNCRWEDDFQQSNNKRNSRIIAWRGREQTMAQWARECGFRRNLIKDRIDRYGWGVEDALTTPVRVRLFA